jgi:hypothetical protein
MGHTDANDFRNASRSLEKRSRMVKTKRMTKTTKRTKRRT